MTEPSTERHKVVPVACDGCTRMRDAALRNLADHVTERERLHKQISELRANLIDIAMLAPPETEAHRIAKEAICG